MSVTVTGSTEPGPCLLPRPGRERERGRVGGRKVEWEMCWGGWHPSERRGAELRSQKIIGEASRLISLSPGCRGWEWPQEMMISPIPWSWAFRCGVEGEMRRKDTYMCTYMYAYRYRCVYFPVSYWPHCGCGLMHFTDHTVEWGLVALGHSQGADHLWWSCPPLSKLT